MTSFNYGQVVSLKLKYAGGSTREFYCIDKASIGVIRLLAEQCSFTDWKKDRPDLWVRKEPEERLIVSKTPSGWLAFRSYKSPTCFRSIEPFTKTLTHLEYVSAHPVPGSGDNFGGSGALLSATALCLALDQCAGVHDQSRLV